MQLQVDTAQDTRGVGGGGWRVAARRSPLVHRHAPARLPSGITCATRLLLDNCWKCATLALSSLATCGYSACVCLLCPGALLQIAAGAEVILTQPPLDWAKFVAWMEDAQQRQLHTAARLLVGFPLLSSAANMTFWAALCGAGGNRQVRPGSQQALLLCSTRQAACDTAA